MRTSILMNSGFVIGTGDVSESALGWCTYNGDHMSMYNPNSSIPKTLVKFLVEWAAHNEFDGDARRTLLDVVDTLISPELLPIGADGAGPRRPRSRRSAPTSCTTSSCSTSSAMGARRRRSSFSPNGHASCAPTPWMNCGGGWPFSCAASSATSSSGRACRTAPRSARSACPRAATGACPATPRRCCGLSGWPTNRTTPESSGRPFRVRPAAPTV